MLGTHDLWLFVLAGVLLNITPGPDVLYIVGRSATQGWRAGATAALGIGAGTFLHIGAAALGLSAVLTASATAFTVLKIVGAIYLVYVGITMLRAPRLSPSSARVALKGASLRAIFMQGMLTNALNPKVAIFFLALLPQFIDANAASKPLAFLFLGAIFNVNGTLWNLFVAWGAARMSHVLEGRPAAWLSRCIGAFFIYLGVRLALSDQG